MVAPLNSLSDADFALLTAVNTARQMGHPLPADRAVAVSHLIAQGLVAVDERGHHVPDAVKWKLVEAQRPLKS